MVLPALEGEPEFGALSDWGTVVGHQGDGDDDGNVPVGGQSFEVTLESGYSHRDELFAKINEQAEDQQNPCNRGNFILRYGLISYVTRATPSPYLGGVHLSAGNVLHQLPPAIGIIHGTEVTEDKPAVEGVVEGEYEVRHHDEEHEVPDHLVELIFQECLTERMLYQIFERSLTQIEEQRCMQSVLHHLLSLEDLREVQMDDGFVFLHSDP